MKAVVLGAGPTGVLAAAELFARGYTTTVVTEKEPERPRGAFYFHDIPAHLKKLHKPAIITHRYAGNHFTYEEKQWDIHYPSSFPLGEILATDRREAWWPTEDLWRDLVGGMTFLITERLTSQQALSFRHRNDIVVVTFPLFHKPHRYLTPMVRIPLSVAHQVINERTAHDWTLWPNELFYDGLPTGYHSEIVRIATPPEDYQDGYCYAELTKTAALATTHWPHRVYYVPDMHPQQPRLEPVDPLPDNVILAGRFALGDPKYLSSHVLYDIEKRLS